ncbi:MULTISPECIES: GNAT family N-acetyltransferase [Protofrankia]|uniref:GNAT family N-acetyltransferase n=1 Tax=Protofrankia TaxID=2994361 RepID=UPI0002FA01D0|nr:MULTISPECIES: GNAT family N-acetyltransferase [Protofrankia]
MRIRPVRFEELSVLQDIERAAGRWFRDIGMPEIADDEPLTVDELALYQRAGHAWGTADGTGRLVAYLITDLVDGNMHIEQVSVRPDSARRGVGRALIEHIADHAAAEAIPALTLTTFVHVPWNAPYYARCGFRCLTEAELAPGLREIRNRETVHGLNRWPRAAMRREVGRYSVGLVGMT